MLCACTSVCLRVHVMCLHARDLCMRRACACYRACACGSADRIRRCKSRWLLSFCICVRVHVCACDVIWLFACVCVRVNVYVFIGVRSDRFGQIWREGGCQLSLCSFFLSQKYNFFFFACLPLCCFNISSHAKT